MSLQKRPRVMRGLAHDGPVLWSYGFRPFFLGGGVWAMMAMLLWILALAHGLPLGGSFGAVLWHGHEMLFGFAPAVLTGYLLTAIPNWTGHLPVSGRPLIGFFSVWVAGRLAMAGAEWIGVLWAAVIDMAFLPLLLAIAAREILAGRKWNDLKLLAAIGGIMAGNLGFHLAVLAGRDPGIWMRAAVAGYVVLILITAGRIIPSFTRNWLNLRRIAPLPVAYNSFDKAVIAGSLPVLACWTFVPESGLTVLAALVAAGLNLWRLARWRGLAIRRESLLAALHLAYGMVALGCLAIAAAGADLLPAGAALHVLTVGAIGAMMLAVMARTTRAHTGRVMAGSRLTALSFMCLFVAALVRPAADLVGQMALIQISGLLWILAFGLFLAEHGVMLTRIRRRLRGDSL